MAIMMMVNKCVQNVMSDVQLVMDLVIMNVNHVMKQILDY